jgi:hypothetical protein
LYCGEATNIEGTWKETVEGSAWFKKREVKREWRTL